MNTTLVLTPSFVLRNNFSLKFKILLGTFCILSVLVMMLLLVYYIFQVNTEISERYSLWEMERKVSEISKENKTLEINSSQVNSLEKLTELLDNLNFQKSDKISYIRILGNQVVAK